MKSRAFAFALSDMHTVFIIFSHFTICAVPTVKFYETITLPIAKSTLRGRWHPHALEICYTMFRNRHFGNSCFGSDTFLKATGKFKNYKLSVKGLSIDDM